MPNRNRHIYIDALLITILMLSASFSYGQDYTIQGLHMDSIFIGFDNQLQINGYYKEIPRKEMTIEKARVRNNLITITSPDVHTRKAGYNQFILTASRVKKENKIYVSVAGIVKDTIVLSSRRMVYNEFFVLQNDQLIKSGTYPLSLIKQIDALKVNINVPWTKILVVGYRITIANENEILLDEYIKGASLNHPEITKAILRLKKNGIIRISKVHARKPWSCGNGFFFELKAG